MILHPTGQSCPVVVVWAKDAGHVNSDAGTRARLALGVAVPGSVGTLLQREHSFTTGVTTVAWIGAALLTRRPS
ncbi:hypothetical protein GCM10017559_75290 [Streptosporangium longisporum]|uniref:Uncharacterized protein n=1 Tax=Streptosporangium longisporum TaxID=46187 RepID=A0ABP6LBL0_9ACTN